MKLFLSAVLLVSAMSVNAAAATIPGDTLPAVADLMTQNPFDLKAMVSSLNSGDFAAAATMLQGRIETLKILNEKGVQLSDNQPDLADTVTMSTFVNIYLGNIDQAKANLAYAIDEQKLAKLEPLRTEALPQFMAQAQQDKDKYGEGVKKLAESMLLKYAKKQ